MPTEKTDARAAVRLTNVLTHDLGLGYTRAETIVQHFAVTEERRDGQRRAVLYGPWEVDPAAVGDGR